MRMLNMERRLPSPRLVTCVMIVAATVALAAACGSPAGPAVAPLRVCADPNNLPFSNHAGEGFENRLAELVAADMGTTVEYTWWAQRRGFVRHTLRAGACDVVMGVPLDYELTRPTRPYYRSSYVFVSRRADHFDVRSFDDEVLRRARIGVHVMGDDYSNAPPAHALSRRGIVANVVGYSIYGDYTTPNPPARLLDAVERGEVDLAVAWGPLAGYFAQRAREPLQLTPVPADEEARFLPFTFDIAMGVRRDDAALRDRLDEIIGRRRADIRAVLSEYGVPLLDDSQPLPKVGGDDDDDRPGR